MRSEEDELSERRQEKTRGGEEGAGTMGNRGVGEVQEKGRGGQEENGEGESDPGAQGAGGSRKGDDNGITRGRTSGKGVGGAGECGKTGAGREGDLLQWQTETSVQTISQEAAVAAGRGSNDGEGADGSGGLGSVEEEAFGGIEGLGARLMAEADELLRLIRLKVGRSESLEKSSTTRSQTMERQDASERRSIVSLEKQNNPKDQLMGR